MGSGGSKLGKQREAVVSKLPRIRFSFDDLKRRRNSSKEGTLSRKTLLKEGDTSLASAEDNKSLMSSSPDGSMRTAKVAPESEPGSLRGEEENHIDNAAEEESDDNDGEESRLRKPGEEDDDDGDLLCPGSPSFRVYCSGVLDQSFNSNDDDYDDTKDAGNDNDDGDTKDASNDDDDDGKKDVVHRKEDIDVVKETHTICESAGQEIVVAPPLVECPEEIPVKTTKAKKDSRMKKFRAVKHLLKFQGCSYPSCRGRPGNGANTVAPRTAY